MTLHVYNLAGSPAAFSHVVLTLSHCLTPAVITRHLFLWRLHGRRHEIRICSRIQNKRTFSTHGEFQFHSLLSRSIRTPPQTNSNKSAWLLCDLLSATTSQKTSNCVHVWNLCPFIKTQCSDSFSNSLVYECRVVAITGFAVTFKTLCVVYPPPFIYDLEII